MGRCEQLLGKNQTDRKGNVKILKVPKIITRLDALWCSLRSFPLSLYVLDLEFWMSLQVSLL